MRVHAHMVYFVYSIIEYGILWSFSCISCVLLSQEVVFYEEGEPIIDGEAGDLKVKFNFLLSGYGLH